MVRRPDDSPGPVPDDDSVDVWGIVVASWRLIAGCAVAGALAGGVVAATAPPSYRSAVTLRLLPTKVIAVTPITVATTRAVLVTPESARAVVQELHLDRDGITAAALAGAIEIKAEGGNLLTVAVTLPSRDAAGQASSALVNRAIAAALALDAAEARAERDALKAELDGAKTRLDRAEERLLAALESTQRGLRERLHAAGDHTAATKRERLAIEQERIEEDYREAARSYRSLAMDYDSADARAHQLVPQIKIVDGPVVGDNPLPRHTTRLGALGLGTGLFLGISLAVLRQAATDARARRLSA